MKAIWNDTVLAESDAGIEREGTYYFPTSAVNMDYLEASDRHTTSPEKGEVSYYHVVVNESRNENAAWYYSNPEEATRELENYIAFGEGIEVTE